MKSERLSAHPHRADARHNGNGTRKSVRLRVLIDELMDEIDFVEEQSIAFPRTSMWKNRDSINFYCEVERFEMILIRSALRRTGGHQLKAARLLNLRPSTLNAKINRYQIRDSFTAAVAGSRKKSPLHPVDFRRLAKNDG